VKSLGELPAFIDALEPEQCMATGVFDVGRCYITPKNTQEKHITTLPVRNRTKEAMRQPERAFALIDYDPSTRMPDALRCSSPEELMGKMGTAIAELNGVAFVGRPSSSSGLYSTIGFYPVFSDGSE
jgi:hypothetical protein